MKKFLHVGLILALIAAVASTALALVNSITAPRIAAYEAEVIQRALSEVAQNYTIGDTREDLSDELVKAVYELVDDDQTLVGYIVQLVGTGYGGAMTVMASYLLSGEVLDARLLSNNETPGLGKKGEDPSYMRKFIGTGSTQLVPTRKGDLSKTDSDAIGGATITFVGIAKAIAHGSDFVQRVGGK